MNSTNSRSANNESKTNKMKIEFQNDLIRRAKAGEMRAQNDLVKIVMDKVFGPLWRKYQNNHFITEDDVMAEIEDFYMAALIKFDDNRDTDFCGYVYKCTDNSLKKKVKGHKNSEIPFFDFYVSEEEGCETPSVSQCKDLSETDVLYYGYTYEEICNLLDASFSSLDNKKRDILMKHFYKGVTLSELAREYGCSVANISKLANSALKKMKERMELDMCA